MKKSWHPVLLVNQERVWKAEKAANEEKKKLHQLRKEQEEERQLAELQRMQEAATGRKRVDRLDWMYAAPGNEGGALGGARIGEREMEDYLLGKRRVDDVLAQSDKNVSGPDPNVICRLTNFQVGNAHKEFIAVQNANTARDTAAKIREDPLLAIKRQELAAIEALKNRPEVRKKLKEMMKDKEAKDKGESKEERKERRRAEKEDRRARREERRGRYSDEEDDRHHRRRDRSEDRYRRRERSPERSRDGGSSSGRYKDERDWRSPRRRSDSRDRTSRDRSPPRRDRHASDDRRRDERSNGHRRPSPDYSSTTQRDIKPNLSRPSAMDMAERPTSSRPPPPPPPAANGAASKNHLDEMRAARLAAMSASANELYENRTKTLATRAEEEQRENARDERMRARYGQEQASAAFFKEQTNMNLSEALGRRAGKGLISSLD